MGPMKCSTFRSPVSACARRAVVLASVLSIASTVFEVAPAVADTVVVQGAGGGFNSRDPNAAPGGGNGSGYGSGGKYHGLKPGEAPADPGPNAMDRDEGFDAGPGCPYSNQKLELIV